MPALDILAQRLRAQHLIQQGFGEPAEVVRWFGAVQAQDYAGSLYAIGLRVRRGTEASVERAIARKEIVRTWPMRGTIHFVPAEDAHWMVRLLARRQNIRLRGVYRRAGLSDEVLKRARKILVKVLSGGQRRMRRELYRALEEAGIHATGAQRGLHILGYWAQEGLICQGSRQGKQTTFALLDEWIPAGRRLEGEEALAELAGRYFASHGPATLQDFAWWSGLSVAEAMTGLQSARSGLVAQRVDDRAYWRSTDARQLRVPSPDVHLLPAYDEFAVAYKDRRAFLDPEAARKALHGLAPCIILDGRIVGIWRRTRRLRLGVGRNRTLRGAQRQAPRGVGKGNPDVRGISWSAGDDASVASICGQSASGRKACGGWRPRTAEAG